MKYKRMVIAFVVSCILFSNFSLCYGADDDLLLPIFVVNNVNETNTRLDCLVVCLIEIVEI